MDYLYKLPIYYDNLGGKKIFTKALSEISVDRKKIHLLYYKKSNLPICAIPKINTVIVSKKSFLSFCYSFYFFSRNSSYDTLSISQENIYYIGKFALCHEIGHLLDTELKALKASSNEIIISIAKSIVKYNIDFKNPNIVNNLPLEIEDYLLDFKKNIVKRELNAWNIGKSLISFDNTSQRELFENMKKYSLATYNYSDFKSFLSENEIEKYLKYI